ncbi:hypothetical protein EKM01_03065 [Flavobacterium sp. RSP46]|uniref:hypothetical protein n=1 Tax=Flavobacterium sp. RSP46 TaxID=2497486 RepID=UPI000F88882A|nr:hypothetical protein [Flavobacterium sp. RSP46]RTY93095.1 hypothetical protein EKM01_03065 [Flavobacterium sp. RSP46]
MLTGGAETGGLITVNSGLVGYVVGNGNDFKYPVKVTVFQGDVTTTKIEIYKSFTNVAGVKSNEILFRTIDLPTTPKNQTIDFTVTYNELKTGLTVGGQPLPTDDSLLKIGDAWTLRYVTTTSESNVHNNSKSTKVAVGTRFAGTYKVIDSNYWRLGVSNGGWNGGIRVIESVDATTYRFVDYAGPFQAATNTHYFTIDASNVVKTPQTYKGAVQLLNGWPLINCTSNPIDMKLSCGYSGPQNTVTKDDVNSKDRIYRTYGYYTGGSGPREFYEALERVVN